MSGEIVTEVYRIPCDDCLSGYFVTYEQGNFTYSECDNNDCPRVTDLEPNF